ncbi:MAG: DUF47 domain-containing protein [Candidatus Hodarchaeota archaeon]
MMVLDNDRFMSSELGNITQMLDEHFRIILSANKMVGNAVTEWLEEGSKISKADLQKITELEEKGDDLKRAILDELSKANSLMQREDLLRLVNYNDKLLDGAEIALYHLAAVAELWTPENEIKSKVSEFNRLQKEEVTQLREAVRFLSINIEESIKKADEICRTEKKIDIVQRDIIGIIYTSDLEVNIILRFRDFLNMMEDIANFGEDAANTIRGLSLTLNT